MTQTYHNRIAKRNRKWVKLKCNKTLLLCNCNRCQRKTANGAEVQVAHKDSMHVYNCNKNKSDLHLLVFLFSLSHFIS